MSEVGLKFASAVSENFNLILSNNKIEEKFEFERITVIYDKLLLKIAVVSNKNQKIMKKGKRNLKNC